MTIRVETPQTPQEIRRKYNDMAITKFRKYMQKNPSEETPLGSRAEIDSRSVKIAEVIIQMRDSASRQWFCIVSKRSLHHISYDSRTNKLSLRILTPQDFNCPEPKAMLSIYQAELQYHELRSVQCETYRGRPLSSTTRLNSHHYES
jgi:hypothetical protein